jgi:Tfp pilus assembly major pilin PilA
VEQLAIIPVPGVSEAIQVPEVTYYVISNGMRAAPPM